jgi:hypothetical protein
VSQLVSTGPVSPAGLPSNSWLIPSVILEKGEERVKLLGVSVFFCNKGRLYLYTKPLSHWSETYHVFRLKVSNWTDTQIQRINYILCTAMVLVYENV